jgi:hypothetical protein
MRSCVFGGHRHTQPNDIHINDTLHYNIQNENETLSKRELRIVLVEANTEYNSAKCRSR